MVLGGKTINFSYTKIRYIVKADNKEINVVRIYLEVFIWEIKTYLVI